LLIENIELIDRSRSETLSRRRGDKSSPVKLTAHVDGHALELAQHAAEVIEGVVLLLLLDLQDPQINMAQ